MYAPKIREGEPPKMTVEDLLAMRAMRASGMSQRQVARVLGVTQPLISFIEHGRLAWVRDYDAQQAAASAA
jgi:transcriptional regulator with XRE-family HTH domain